MNLYKSGDWLEFWRMWKKSGQPYKIKVTNIIKRVYPRLMREKGLPELEESEWNGRGKQVGGFYLKTWTPS